MIDMKLSNNKLNKRAINMIINQLNITEKEAELLIKKYKSVRNVIENYEKN